MKLSLQKAMPKSNFKFTPEFTKTLLIIATGVGLSAFCLFSAKSLASKAIYQQKVISGRHKAIKQLQSDIAAAKTLSNQYDNVIESDDPSNIIGAQNDKSSSAVPPNGDNASIILDALPTTYDFPATALSVSKLLSDNGISNATLGASDQSASVTNQPTANPQPQPFPIPVTGSGTYGNIQNLVRDMERSIRPIDITIIDLSGTESSMTADISASTYYQPATTFSVDNKVVK